MPAEHGGLYESPALSCARSPRLSSPCCPDVSGWWFVTYSRISAIKNKKMKGWYRYHTYLYYGAERQLNGDCTAERCNQKNGGLIARNTALRCCAVDGAQRQTVHCPLNIVHCLGLWAKPALVGCGQRCPGYGFGNSDVQESNRNHHIGIIWNWRIGKITVCKIWSSCTSNYFYIDLFTQMYHNLQQILLRV